MKPSDFKLNSDYLTLANVENRTYSATIAAAIIPHDGIYTASYTFSCKSVDQAITRACMRHSKWNNQSIWGVGTSGYTAWEDNGHFIDETYIISTPNSSTVKLDIQLRGDAGINVPAHTITLKVFRFKVPNVF